MISQYILKVHSRCDLACDHCYVYRHEDQTWLKRPPVMSQRTARAAANAIAAHASAHGQQLVRVILHGGEPLLLGPSRMRTILSRLQDTIGSVAKLDLSMQTNGVRLNPEMCDLLLEYGVRVGVSLDGGASANDRHRKFRDGSGSYEKVLGALELLRSPRYRQLYSGILCTVDIANDPREVFDALWSQHPPRIDFLLPHATWDRPPPGASDQETPYAAWLLAVHDRWSQAGQPMPVRLFDSLRSLAAGGPSETEALGLEPADLVVVETDGAWEQADSLKTSYDGAAATGLTVFAHSVDEVVAHSGIASRQSGVAGLSSTCQSCSVVNECGGGLYAHRYRTGKGFDNPSVYCGDLKTLITTLTARDRRQAKVPPDVLLELATGNGNEQTMDFLASAQMAITRSLVAEVGDSSSEGSGPLSRAAQAGWKALVQLDNESAEAMRTVLAHPFLRSWALGCLEESHGGAERDRAYLASIAVAVAIHARATLTLQVPVQAGWVVLPTLGRVLAPPVTAGLAEVSCANGELFVQSRQARWQRLRYAEVGGLSVSIEDTDPYRDCYETPLTSRLPEAAVETWTRQIAAAWELIRLQQPGQVASLRRLLRCIVPRPALATQESSSTAIDAFGAISVALPPTPVDLAAMLVHEIQHVKLSALLDLDDLVRPGSGILIKVAWRDDLRPPEAVLQGIYAHAPAAEATAKYLEWTLDAIGKLRESATMTPLGLDFLEGLSESITARPSEFGDGQLAGQGAVA